MKSLRASRLSILAALLLPLSLLFGACREASTAGRPAILFAAASLTKPFQELAAAFERSHPGQRVELHFAGTPQLVVQLQAGAPADLLASADLTNMQRVVDLGRTASPPVPFARNRLTIVTAAANPHAIRSLADLARPELRVLLCGPEVPAGRYAREALAKAGITLQSRSDEPSVKAVVSKIRLGEADAGIVYVTDATAAGPDVAAVLIPDEHNVVASYPVALLHGGHAPQVAAAFLAFLRADEGQRILQASGFQRP